MLRLSCGKGSITNRKRNENGTEMERKWNGNGAGREREGSGKGKGREKEGKGKMRGKIIYFAEKLANVRFFFVTLQAGRNWGNNRRNTAEN